jgi:hypothetical protein
MNFFLALFACLAALVAESHARPTNANALADIDLRREAVVHTIIGQWQHELPTALRSGLAEKLGGLRADQLLAARLAESVEGVLEIVHAASLVENALRANAFPFAELSAPASDAEDYSTPLPIARDGLFYVALAPCRIVDTHRDLPFGLQGKREPRTFVASSRDASHFTAQGGAAHDCNIPASARALMAKVSVINPTEVGYVAASASGLEPDHSIIAFTRGLPQRTLAGVGLVPLARSHAGDFVVAITQGGQSTAHLTIDVMGYYAAPLLQQNANTPLAS